MRPAPRQPLARGNRRREHLRRAHQVAGRGPAGPIGGRECILEHGRRRVEQVLSTDGHHPEHLPLPGSNLRDPELHCAVTLGHGAGLVPEAPHAVCRGQQKADERHPSPD